MDEKERLENLVKWMNNDEIPASVVADMVYDFLRERINVWFNDVINQKIKVDVKFDLNKSIVIDFGFTGHEVIQDFVEDIKLGKKIGFDTDTEKWFLNNK